MLVSQCPRCHESVCVPDTLLTGSNHSHDAVALAQCPWCLETLDGSELRAVLPPPLILVGEQSVLSSSASPDEQWASGSQNLADVNLGSGTLASSSASRFQGSQSALVDHAPENPSHQSNASGLDSLAVDHSHVEQDPAVEFQQSNVHHTETAAASPVNPPQRVIKISVPGKSGTDKSAAMMDIDSSHSRRRSKKSSPLKTMLGVALGGLLALPIVGIILHFATGQYVPYISDILPGGGSARTQNRASAPMPIDYSQPQLAEDSSPTPLEGKSIGDDLPDPDLFGEPRDPADAALQAIADETTNANTGANTDGSDQLSSDTINNTATLTDNSTAPPGSELIFQDDISADDAMPNAIAPNEGQVESDPRTGVLPPDTAASADPIPDPAMPDNLFDNTLPDDDIFGDGAPTENTLGDNLPSDDLPSDDLPSDDLPSDNVAGDDVSGDDMLGGADPEGDVLDAFDPGSMSPDDIDGNIPPDFTDPRDATEASSDSLDASAVSPELTTSDATDDLFGGTSEISFPTPAAPETAADQPPTLNVDAEIAALTRTLDEIQNMAADAPQRGERVEKLYESLSILAGEVDSNSVAKLNPLLNKISANTTLVIAFAKATPGWVSRSESDRGGDGAVVVGKMSGDAANATFTLLNKQELPVKLPPSIAAAPEGFQVGLGRINGSGADASLTLDLLSEIKK